MENSVILKFTDTDNTIKFYILGLNDREFFDSLLNYLTQQWNAYINNIDEGIGIIKANLNIHHLTLTLEHDDMMGNCIYTYDKNALLLLEKITKDLEVKLKNVPYE